MEIGSTENLYAVIVRAPDDGTMLPAILDSLAELSLPAIVVDSSHENGTRDVISAWMRERPGAIVHSISASRRRALWSGFARAMELGFSHAITLDWKPSRNRETTTGSPMTANPAEPTESSLGDFAIHPASCVAQPVTPPRELDDLTHLLKTSAEHPSALVLGAGGDSPRQSFLTRLSDLLLRLETGLRLRDPRSSLRIYPLRLIEMISPNSTRNSGEMELFVRAAWVGCPVMETLLSSPAASSPEFQSPSHGGRRPPFPWLTHLRLVTRALSGWPHPKYSAAAASAIRPSFWQSIWQWCNPLRAWRELRQGRAAGRAEMAAGIALGVFIANLPAYGFQTVLALYAARRLHLHPFAVVAGSKASTPPVGPLLIAAAIFVGHLLLHGSKPQWKNIMPFDGQFLARVGPILLEWLVGSVVMGVVTAIGAFIAASFLFRLIEQGGAGDASGTGKVAEAPAKPTPESGKAVPIPPT